MHLEIREQSPVLRMVRATVPAERLQNRLEEAYRRLRQRAHIRGFRPGRAPLELIRRLYGEAVRSEVYEELANEVASAIWQEGHRPFGSVRIRSIETEENGDLHIEAEFDVKPEFELVDFEGVEVRVPVHAVRSEDVERELEQLRAHRAVLLPREGPAGRPVVSLASSYVMVKTLTASPRLIVISAPGTRCSRKKSSRPCSQPPRLPVG